VRLSGPFSLLPLVIQQALQQQYQQYSQLYRELAAVYPHLLFLLLSLQPIHSSDGQQRPASALQWLDRSIRPTAVAGLAFDEVTRTSQAGLLIAKTR
jgi:hypothetical protein